MYGTNIKGEIMSEVKASELLGATIVGIIGIIASTFIMLFIYSKYPDTHPITYMISVGGITLVTTLLGFFIDKST